MKVTMILDRTERVGCKSSRHYLDSFIFLTAHQKVFSIVLLEKRKKEKRGEERRRGHFRIYPNLKKGFAQLGNGMAFIMASIRISHRSFHNAVGPE